MAEYQIVEGSVHDRFQNSRVKLQIFGGGFGNGKTAAGVVKALRLAQEYPGSNGLIARSTYPKLNDTIRKEFLKWCPKEWIKSFPMSVNASNTCTLTNGTEINFRYIAQQGKSEEQTTSNLLSATYDWIVVDQMEDPEISYKDFLDLLGRLRGNAPYKGDDPTMPKSGPRWLIILCNPTRNWLFQKLVHPYQLFKESNGSVVHTDLLIVRDLDGNIVLNDNGDPTLLMELFEAPTHANALNLGVDFIQTLESAYKGQMRDRFLLGKWAAYEGLIYNEFDEQLHYLPQSEMHRYVNSQYEEENYVPTFVEAYDYGLSSPSCYLLGIVDRFGNVLVVDGFYKPEFYIGDQAKAIRDIRSKWTFGHFDIDTWILGDPDIFRRKAAGKVVGKSVSELFHEEDSSIRFTRGNNDIKNGITKVKQYLAPATGHRHIITGNTPAPYIYFASELPFIGDEMGGYFWRKDPSGRYEDEPISKSVDHALDTIKYMLSFRPSLGSIVVAPHKQTPAYLLWHEQEPRSARRG